MSKFTQDFFETLSTTGEMAVLGVVRTLANRGDFEGLHAFMDFSSQNLNLFPNLHKLEMVQVQCLTGKGVQDHQNTNFFQSLRDPMVGGSESTESESKKLSEEKIDHAKKFLVWASSNSVDNHQPLRLAFNYLVTFACDLRVFQAIELACKAALIPVPVADLFQRALIEKNLVAANYFFTHLTSSEACEFSEDADTTSGRKRLGTAVESIAEMLFGSSEKSDGMLDLIDRLEEKIGTAAIASLRVRLLADVMNKNKKIEDSSRFYAMVGRLHGASEDRLKSQQEWLTDAVNQTSLTSLVAEHLIRSIVEKNCVELFDLVLPLVADEATHAYANIAIAMQGGFSIASGSEGGRRMRATIEFLQNCGQSLENANPKTGDPATPALHFLAQSSNSDFFPLSVEKLVVLLDMGSDPKEKDNRKKMPHHYLDAESKALWHYTINAHKARVAAHDVLAEIDQSAAS